jgi:hypothetical protein
MTRPGPWWLGLDGGRRDMVDLEHLALQVHQQALPDASVVCTHIARTGRPHYAASFELRCPPEQVPALLGRITGLATQAAVAALPAAADPDGSQRAGPPALATGATQAAADHRARRGGRAIRFPGQDHLPDVVAVGTLLATSAIQQLHGLGCQVTPDALLDTGGFLRPVYQDGPLCLTVTPGTGGCLRPFEIEHPPPVLRWALTTHTARPNAEPDTPAVRSAPPAHPGAVRAGTLPAQGASDRRAVTPIFRPDPTRSQAIPVRTWPAWPSTPGHWSWWSMALGTMTGGRSRRDGRETGRPPHRCCPVVGR